jgi:hypothetical protein
VLRIICVCPCDFRAGLRLDGWMDNIPV